MSENRPKENKFKGDFMDWKNDLKTFDFTYRKDTCPVVVDGGNNRHYYEHDKTLDELEHDYEYDYDTCTTQMGGFDDCVYDVRVVAYYQPVGHINNTSSDYSVIDKDIAGTNETTLKYFQDTVDTIPVKALESGFVMLQKPVLKDDTIARVKWGVYYCVEIARKDRLTTPLHLESVIHNRVADYIEFGTRNVSGLQNRVRNTVMDIMRDVLKNPCDWSDDYNEKYLEWEMKNMMNKEETPEKEGKKDCQDVEGK